MATFTMRLHTRYIKSNALEGFNLHLQLRRDICIIATFVYNILCIFIWISSNYADPECVVHGFSLAANGGARRLLKLRECQQHKVWHI